MTPKERAVTALNRRIPDMVPTFELEFQLEEEMFGSKFYTNDLSLESLSKMSLKEKEKRIFQLAEYAVHVFSTLDYSIFPSLYLGDFDSAAKTKSIIPIETKMLIKYMRELVGDNYMLQFHGDATYSIPDGNGMYDFAYALVDNPAEVKKNALKMALNVIERNKAVAAVGIDTLILCSDYCFNSGPFISPSMFEEFIQPYLYMIIDAAKKDGLYTIKHTDGNIMPILNQLVECRPDALHSIDPMAGVDIKEVKRLVGTQVCLCGNVHCASLQTGTDEEVIESAKYCLTHAKPNGGYIFSTSNIPFKGMPPERYSMILDIWKQMRTY